MNTVVITKNADSRHFTGIIFNRIPVRNFRGELATTWVVGFRTDFKFKEQLKGFCTARGGGWDPVEKLWFVPLLGTTVKEILPQLWAVVSDASTAISECLPETIEVSVEADLGKHEAIVLSWLATKAAAFQPAPKPIDKPIDPSLPQHGLNGKAWEQAEARQWEEEKISHWQGEY